MAHLIDLWRIIDVEASWISGDARRLVDPVRALARSRSSVPRIPILPPGTLLLVEAGHLGGRADALLADLEAAEIRPAGVIVAGGRRAIDGSNLGTPLLTSALPASVLAQAGDAYLSDESQALDRAVFELRLAAAERALADPQPAAVAGLGAARLRRGVAISVDGRLVAVVPRVAGRALAARFAAIHARLLVSSAGRGGAIRAVDGLAVHEQRIRAGAAIWLFDDVPLSRLDVVAAGALAVTLRALLRRQPSTSPVPPRLAPSRSTAGPMADTLLAVARNNGRIAPAARELGVHRNTVLYRLKIAGRDLDLDPRRPADALRILREAQPGS
jgi:hypothetical protein